MNKLKNCSSLANAKSHTFCVFNVNYEQMFEIKIQYRYEMKKSNFKN